MAARNTDPIRSLTQLVDIPGSFATNGSGAIDATSRKGPGFSVARTDVGLGTITFSDKYADLVSVHMQLQSNAAADAEVQPIAFDGAAKTLTFRHLVAGVVAEFPAANANNRINFRASFRNTTVGPTRG